MALARAVDARAGGCGAACRRLVPRGRRCAPADRPRRQRHPAAQARCAAHGDRHRRGVPADPRLGRGGRAPAGRARTGRSALCGCRRSGLGGGHGQGRGQGPVQQSRSAGRSLDADHARRSRARGARDASSHRKPDRLPAVRQTGQRRIVGRHHESPPGLRVGRGARAGAASRPPRGSRAGDRCA